MTIAQKWARGLVRRSFGKIDRGVGRTWIYAYEPETKLQ